jgi:hypothetical protein
MQREGSRRSSSFEASARKTQTGLANCDGSLFSLRRDGKRKALGQSHILSSELEVYPAPCLADFITKCDRISRSHASTNVGVQTDRGQNISIFRLLAGLSWRWHDRCLITALTPIGRDPRESLMAILFWQTRWLARSGNTLRKSQSLA